MPDRFKSYLPYILWVLGLFFLAYMKIFQHELWKDEWQAWFVARDKSIGEILSFLYYEGHPALWYLYLKAFTWIPSVFEILPEYVIMSAHTILVAAYLYVLIIRFKLPLWLKLLSLCTYFVFFEYGLISRGYAFVILLGFIAAILIRENKTDKPAFGITLLLLCHTEVYGVFMALALGLFSLMQSGWSLSSPLPRFTGYLTGGVLLFIISVFPRSAGHVARTQPGAPGYFEQFLNSFQGNLSNTFLIGATPDTGAYGWSVTGILLSMLVLAVLVFLFKNDRKILITAGFFLSMMVLFGTLFFSGGVRQWGMSFVFFLMLLEISSILNDKRIIYQIVPAIFMLFAAIHGFRAVKTQFDIPFTNAKQAGHFIRENVPEKVPVVGINKFEITPVIGYAGRPFYELPDGVPFTYFRWVDKVYLPTENELHLFTRFKKVGGIVVISSRPLDSGRFPTAQLWKTFDATNYKRENYYIYSLPLKQQN